MHSLISVFLIAVMVLLYFAGIVPSFKLALYTSDKGAHRIRFYTAVINVGFFLLAAALLFARVELYRGNYTGAARILKSYTMDIIVTINAVAVLVQLLGANKKIKYLTHIYYEVKRLKNDANTDTLTGLLNRRALLEFLSKTYDTSMTILMIDIDDFKAYNDKFGHLEGDALLSKLGHSIPNCLRETDLAFRYGGEEILVLCPGASADEGKIIAEDIKKTISEFDGVRGGVTVSIGVGYCVRGINLVSIIKLSDLALYEAKRSGKDRIISLTDSDTDTSFEFDLA